MKRLSFIGLAAVGLLLTACQSKSYKIEGSGDALQDGDTLYITTDIIDGTPQDTIVVTEGGFKMESETDSTVFCMIYNPKKQGMAMPFFIEPGTIKLILSDNSTQSKVSGTKTNNRWQELNDTTVKIGMKINRIATYIYETQLSDTEQSAKMAEIDKLNEEFKTCIADYAERNIDNELGRFMLTYYPEDVIPADKKLTLISKMPSKTQERQAVKTLKKRLEELSQYTVGRTLKDFTMADINGKEVSVLQEIKRNKLTVIDFWASWCEPCRAEMPSVVKLYDEYHAKGLGIIGISLDNERDKWQAAVKQLGMKWMQLSDLKGWDNAAARKFAVESIPHTIIVDSNGVIQQRGLRSDELREFVTARLK